MAGDYTRRSFRPERDFAALLKQQGRVDLDADWNELVDIFKRRFWTETVDLVGRCAIPRRPADQFKVLAAGAGFTIGTGRAYVDGLQAENHGTGSTVHEPVWGDPTGSGPVDYAHQPYLDPAPAVPAGAGPHLFYLDVWEREITAVEDPHIVEPALGVDTATRRQTVWQVRILPDLPAGTKCSSDWTGIPAWTSVTAPSGGLLTTQAIGISAPDDPCLIPPTGGYRGLENRLYRVEIHDDGSAAGNALSFKWSRDNASVAAIVTSIANAGGAAPKVSVDRIGRDAILRFNPGDWVELIDDILELSGQPGVMARIAPQGVDATTNTLTLTAALGGSIDTTRNARIRRWDQKGGVNARGVIPLGALPATFQLEDGVQVTFDLAAAGTSFHVADSWSFAARVADASVELLTSEPPQAIRHHYCRLAILDNGRLEDCRTLYPPRIPASKSCDCDACVSPQQQLVNPTAIQEAVTKVGKVGGKVCLLAGIYRLREPIRIAGAHSLTLVGKGHRTILSFSGDGPAIEIANSAEVTVRNLLVATKKTSTKSRTLHGAIEIVRTLGATIERCFIGQLGALIPSEPGPTLPYPGIGIGLGRFIAETTIRENVILTDVGVGVLSPGTALTFGARSDAQGKAMLEQMNITDSGKYLITYGLWIEDNLMLCRHAGVDLGRAGDTQKKWAKVAPLMIAHLGDTRIAGNSVCGADEVGIIVSGAVVNAKLLSGAVVPAETKNVLPGLNLAAAAARLDVRGNLVSVSGDGIVVASDQARIEDNDVVAAAERRTADGIRLAAGAKGRILDATQIVGNRVTGFSRHGIAVFAAPNCCLIKLNQIEKAGTNGIFVSPAGGKAGAGRLAIENNQILGVGAAPVSSTVYGIYASAVSGLRLVGNSVTGVGQNENDAISRVGIEIDACPSALVTDNQVTDVGPAGTPLARPTLGIHAANLAGRLDFSGNQVDLTNTGDGDSYVLALQIGDLLEFVAVVDDGVDTGRVAGPIDLPDHGDPAPLRLGSALVRAKGLSGRFPIVATGDEFWVIKGRAIQEILRDQEKVTVHGNVFEASGRFNAAWVATSGSCLFSDNRCRLEGAAASSYESAVFVLAEFAAVVASANQILGSAQYTNALDINRWTHASASVVANVVDADILLNGSSIGAPWHDVNVRV